jgi:hypothetical protein
VKNEPLLTKIESAKLDMLAAEDELAAALRDLEVLPRAEKTTISAALEDAFAKVRAARTNLSDLEKLVAGEE